MTLKWALSGLGTAEQTCHVFDGSGKEIANETREGWSWESDEWPDWVGTVVGNNDFQALYMGDIERDQSMLDNLPSNK